MHKSQTQINPDTWYPFSIENNMWFCWIHHVSQILQSFKQGQAKHEQRMLDSILIPELHPQNPVSPLRLSLVGQWTAGCTVVWQGWHARIAWRPTTWSAAARILRGQTTKDTWRKNRNGIWYYEDRPRKRWHVEDGNKHTICKGPDTDEPTLCIQWSWGLGTLSIFTSIFQGFMWPNLCVAHQPKNFVKSWSHFDRLKNHRIPWTTHISDCISTVCSILAKQFWAKTSFNLNPDSEASTTSGFLFEIDQLMKNLKQL